MSKIKQQRDNLKRIETTKRNVSLMRDSSRAVRRFVIVLLVLWFDRVVFVVVLVWILFLSTWETIPTRLEIIENALQNECASKPAVVFGLEYQITLDSGPLSGHSVLFSNIQLISKWINTLISLKRKKNEAKRKIETSYQNEKETNKVNQPIVTNVNTPLKAIETRRNTNSNKRMRRVFKFTKLVLVDSIGRP